MTTELQVTINNLKEGVIAAELMIDTLEKAKEVETHKWEHGDIYETWTGNIMVYLKFAFGPPQTVCLEGLCSGMVKPEHIERTLQNAKFLFNITEKL